MNYNNFVEQRLDKAFFSYILAGLIENVSIFASTCVSYQTAHGYLY